MTEELVILVSQELPGPWLRSSEVILQALSPETGGTGLPGHGGRGKLCPGICSTKDRGRDFGLLSY